MKKSLYICNANNSKELLTYYKYGIRRILWSTSVTRWVVRKTLQGVRSLFVHTNAKLVRLMRTTNKQAMTAKHSNRSAIDIVIVISTIVISILLLIFAPSVLMAIAKFIGVCVLVALAVIPMLHAINILKYEQ